MNMKRSLIVASVLAVSMTSVALAITEAQSIVIPGLKTLKFKTVESKLIGGDQKFKVTPETIELLQQALDKDQTIVVRGNGQLTIE